MNLSRVKLYFRFACETPQGKYIIGQDSLFRCFPLCVVRSPPRLFVRLNHLRIPRKRCTHSTFSSQATRRSKSVNLGFVPQQQIRRNLRLVVLCVLNTINSNKRIAEIFTIQVPYFIEILLIQSQVVSLNHFGSRIKLMQRIITSISITCQQKLLVVHLLLVGDLSESCS